MTMKSPEGYRRAAHAYAVAHGYGGYTGANNTARDYANISKDKSPVVKELYRRGDTLDAYLDQNNERHKTRGARIQSMVNRAPNKKVMRSYRNQADDMIANHVACGGHIPSHGGGEADATNAIMRHLRKHST